MRRILPTVVTILVFAIAIVVFAVFFVGASLEAKNSGIDGTFPRALLGLPVLEGFRTDGRFGIHVLPGALVFLVVPIVVAIGVSIPALRRFSTGRQ